MSATPALAPVMAPSLRAEVPKLRSSCDGCGTAKVKCDRGRPRCGRCETLSMGCSYGPSRNIGKPSRKRPRSDQDATMEKRIRNSWTDPHSCDIFTHTAVAFGERQSIREPVQNNFSNTATDVLSFPSGINTGSDFSQQNQLTSDSYPFLPCEEWPQLGEWHQFDSFGTGRVLPSASPLEPVSTVSQSSHESHSCPRESYEIFRDLICPTPSLHAPELSSLTVSAHLDQVLHFNRNAIDRLSRVLGCHCATSGHRAMVHASIVSRILIWYQQAAGWTGSNPERARPSAMANSPTSRPVSPSSHLPMAAGTSTTKPSSLVQSTGFSVEHVPVSIGTFSIEDQKVQAAFRCQLILSELKKTANLIDMFTSQDLCDSTSTGGAGLHSHLGRWLRSEYSRTVRILKSELSALNEDLES